MKEYRNVVENLSFFRDSQPRTRKKLWDTGTVRAYPRGTVLQHFGEPIRYLYVQLEGKSISYNLTHIGQRKILFVFGGGAILNHCVLGSHPAAVYYETIEKSVLFRIPTEKLLQCMAQDFGLTQALMREQERKLRRLGHQLKNTVGSIYMERKLASKLWKLARDFGIARPNGIEIDLNLTITFLADMLGAPRETTSRTCKTLAASGLIQVERKRVTVLDMGRLASFYKTGTLPPPENEN